MNYGLIRTCDVANGEGVRVSLFVSGCRRNCPGCFNKEAQSFDYGQRFTDATLSTILEALNHDYISGLTILGGEPMELENQPDVLHIVQAVHPWMRGRNKTIWLYTGYLLDEHLVPGGSRFIESVTDKILENVDVVVDGPFIESLKDPSLKFRGSSNQRIITLNETKGN